MGNYVRNFKEYKPLFNNWIFSVGEFDQIEIEDDDFIYADPPYDVEFRQYSKVLSCKCCKPDEMPKTHYKLNMFNQRCKI